MLTLIAKHVVHTEPGMGERPRPKDDTMAVSINVDAGNLIVPMTLKRRRRNWVSPVIMVGA